MGRLLKGAILALLCVMAADAMAVPTRIMVRVKARDAKFIGSSMGGAYVQITNQLTGRLITEGYTEGSTGSTDIIMRQPHARNGKLTNDATAGFLATLDIEEPVFVTISVLGPVNDPQARVMATTQLWVIPGKHIEGDGIILEIPGMVVNITSPQMTDAISLDGNSNVQLSAHVIMMCGCPITEDGLWDSNDVEVKAMVYQEGDLKKVVPLIWKGRNTFEGQMPVSTAGLYEIMIYAYNSKTGNTGLDKVNINVSLAGQ